ncbi:MAG TPA: peptide chain release factor N(5)-glutamine methyltransferase [Syntrophomonadaceae bacterium]|nr:peptide chain release factor N(5)-glutamine methyltransferase [Syntrophomonadaceae bacterium]HQA06595.1 peptide chain release factor N(5)-glutamine methyltransferase [Syntrophomonadaceae bacterium]HQE22332.1 peptide chain release factor N(5)-glutamine methyltransferase [Syntrophomonadaceae bacterium]
MQETWTIKDLLAWTTRFFTDKGIEEPRLNAEALLARVLKKDRVYLYANYFAPVNQNEREQYRELIKRRAAREPLAYLLGKREFMSLDFRVTPEVLIPRPETELLVETVLQLATKDQPVSICDVGTGSGAIAVSLAYYIPHAQVTAIDISGAALEIARYNAEEHGVKVHFLEGDLLASVPAGEQFDFICANLPYISEAEYPKLDPEVLHYEPRLALWGSGDGLELYRRLIPQAWQHLHSDGYLLMEIGCNQAEAAVALCSAFSQVQVRQDWAGRDRLIIAQKGDVSGEDHILAGES